MFTFISVLPQLPFLALTACLKYLLCIVFVLLFIFSLSQRWVCFICFYIFVVVYFVVKHDSMVS